MLRKAIGFGMKRGAELKSYDAMPMREKIAYLRNKMIDTQSLIGTSEDGLYIKQYNAIREELNTLLVITKQTHKRSQLWEV